MKRNDKIILKLSLVLSTFCAPLMACATREQPLDDDEANLTETTGSPAQTPSGESLCNTAPDCSDGLSCEHSTLGSSGVCAASCGDDSDCSAGRTCVDGSSVGFDASCLERCTSATDCSAGFGCFEIDEGRSVCLPSDWGTSEPTKKGIGDACSSDVDCASSMCVGGWCTEYCGSGNTGCWGDYDGKNEFGNYNWCVRNAANDYICFPGCTGNSGVCGNYDATYCQGTTDADGYSADICSG